MARKTIFAGFAPTRRGASAKRRLVAVVAFDGVVLGDLATPVEIFGLVRDGRGAPCYEVHVCSARPKVASEHVKLTAPWRLSSLQRAHTVIVPGIDNIDRKLPEELLRALRAVLKRGARIASIAPAPSFLHKLARSTVSKLQRIGLWLGNWPAAIRQSTSIPTCSTWITAPY